MDKVISFLSSTRLMAVLFIVFAFAMAVGTFIEDAYNTETARLYIYNAKWFEIIMLFFVINFIGNIKRYQLHKKRKMGYTAFTPFFYIHNYWSFYYPIYKL